MSHTIVTKDIICVHIFGNGTADGAWSWAHQVGSHYHGYLHGSGRQDQAQDLRFRAAANLHGNHRVIAFGTADGGSPFARWDGRCGNVPAFSNAQVDRLVRDIAWTCARFNIPPRLIPDTKPGRRGVAYHRQGINPWRVAGGELWSSSTGKCCPDHRRINQINNVILPRVRAVLGQAPPPPPPPPDGGFLMALSDAQQKEVYEVAKSFNTRVDMLLQARLAEFFKGSNYVRIFDWMLGRTLNPKGVDLGSHDGHGRKRVKELINEVLDERLGAAAPK